MDGSGRRRERARLLWGEIVGGDTDAKGQNLTSGGIALPACRQNVHLASTAMRCAFWLRCR